MVYTPDEFRCRYPEFADTTEYPDNRIQLFIEDAQDDIGLDADYWGGPQRYSRAIAALTAHMLVVGIASEYGDYSPMKDVIIKQAGDVKVHHADTGRTPQSVYEDGLMATSYGRTFLAIRRKQFVTVLSNGLHGYVNAYKC